MTYSILLCPSANFAYPIDISDFTLASGYHVQYTELGQPVIFISYSSSFTVSAMTSVLSHEFQEVITDISGLGWLSARGLEICDLCEDDPSVSVNLGGNPYEVVTVYSNVDQMCLYAPTNVTLSAPFASQCSSLSGPASSSGFTQTTAVTTSDSHSKRTFVTFLVWIGILFLGKI